MRLRQASGLDSDEIHELYMTAFGDQEGRAVARLAIDLLIEDTTPAVLPLVAVSRESITGHVAFSPVTIEGRDAFSGYILSPLAVRPELQQRGIGRKLVEYGMRRLSEIDVAIVFVYGDPDYYGRFGFSADAAHEYSAPYPLQYPLGWQAVALKEPNPGTSPAKVVCVGPLSEPGLW